MGAPTKSGEIVKTVKGFSGNVPVTFPEDGTGTAPYGVTLKPGLRGKVTRVVETRVPTKKAKADIASSSVTRAPVHVETQKQVMVEVGLCDYPFIIYAQAEFFVVVE